MKYTNPILRGCYPDPSICRAGEYFYIVNSTFEFIPGIPVFRSKNLVQWEQVGHCLTRNSQLHIVAGHEYGRQSASGIYAPTIRFKDGRFYMITTNMLSKEDSGNFFMWTDDIEGEWSDPIFLDTPGIDPSFFFDDDGRTYYVGTSDNQIYVSEIDLETGKLLSDRHVLWGGTGGAYPEGPHIYKKDGIYYLMISEGGTERAHMITMAKSDSLFGKYTPCPHNPLLTNRSLLRPLEAIGHADLVQDLKGNWWAVCLGTRTFSYPPKHNLGRETMLIPVNWDGEWPVFGNDGTCEKEYDVELPAPVEGPIDFDEKYECNFSAAGPDMNWNYLYNPVHENYIFEDGAVKLLGDEHCLYDWSSYTWLGRRQRAHNTTAGVTLTFAPVNEGEEAGFTLFMNHKHHYAAGLICEEGQRKIIFYRRIGSLMNREAEIVVDTDTVTFEIDSDKDFYTFYYRIDGGERTYLGRGETVYITTEVGGSFTGNYYAMYAVGNGKKSETFATFTKFKYEEKDLGI